MKRIICIALCVLLSLLVCACDGKNGSTPTQAQPEETAQQPTESTVAPTENTATLGLKNFISSFDTTPTVEEKLLYDSKFLTVTVKGISYTGVTGPELQLSIENQYSRDVIVQAPYAIVNGYMITPEMNTKVATGKTTQGTLTLPYFNLAISGINTLKKIEFAFRVVEAENYNPITTTDLLTVETSAPQDEELACDDSGQVAYDENDIKIVFKGFTTDRAYSEGAELIVYMYNGTDKNIAIRTDNVVVNGYDMTSAMNSTILPDKRAVDVVTIYKLDMEEYGIDEIDSVKVSFAIKDAGNWETIDSTELISVDLKAIETQAATQAATEIATESE